MHPEGGRRRVHLVRNGPRHAAAVAQLLVSGIHDGTDFLLAQVAVSGLKQHRASHVAGAHLEGVPGTQTRRRRGGGWVGGAADASKLNVVVSGTSAILFSFVPSSSESRGGRDQTFHTSQDSF